MTDHYRELRDLTEERLESLFSGEEEFAHLNEAMRYSLLAGGKRLRPVLAMAFCEACGTPAETALDPACALELLHTYSLIHDDLPCMDDDDLRRGKPTSHKVFGEGTAVLAGDCLQAEAFALLLSCRMPPDRVVAMAQALSQAAGLYGICGAQALDLAAEGKTLTGEQLVRIHHGKTAALLTAAAEIGVIAGDGGSAELDAARTYASDVGLAFQIRDDVLDVISTDEELGKPVGSDAANGKSTFVTLFGQERCAAMIRELTEHACSSLKGAFPCPDFLIWLAEYMAERNK
ncbi:MAG: polyprenyl synthetase family protein [Oscillospiraceae bacterium]|nr:polyprenyl synthetase family protein [Oscillospiraceae bacterium]